MVGAKIKKLRLRNGYTLHQLAEKIEISKSYLSYIERGIQKNPSIKVLSKIAVTFNTTVDELMGNSSLKKAEQLDQEWQGLINEAIDLGISKRDFEFWLDFIKFQKANKNEKK